VLGFATTASLEQNQPNTAATMSIAINATRSAEIGSDGEPAS
jgi:hypothetical protein